MYHRESAERIQSAIWADPVCERLEGGLFTRQWRKIQIAGIAAIWCEVNTIKVVGRNGSGERNSLFATRFGFRL